LTVTGRKLLQEILPHYYAAAERVWGEFSASRANQLIEELTRVCANAEDVAVKGQAN